MLLETGSFWNGGNKKNREDAGNRSKKLKTAYFLRDSNGTADRYVRSRPGVRIHVSQKYSSTCPRKDRALLPLFEAISALFPEYIDVYTVFGLVVGAIQPVEQALTRHVELLDNPRLFPQGRVEVIPSYIPRLGTTTRKYSWNDLFAKNANKSIGLTD